MAKRTHREKQLKNKSENSFLGMSREATGISCMWAKTRTAGQKMWECVHRMASLITIMSPELHSNMSIMRSPNIDVLKLNRRKTYLVSNETFKTRKKVKK